MSIRCGCAYRDRRSQRKTNDEHFIHHDVRIAADKSYNSAELFDFLWSVTDLSTLTIPENCIVALIEHGPGQWRQFHSIRTSPVHVHYGRAALTRSGNQAAADSVEVQRDVCSDPF